MNSNHTITMNNQQMQRRPYSRGAISRNHNHRMQRIQPFSPQMQQQQQRNLNNGGNSNMNNGNSNNWHNNGNNNPNGNSNANKDILEYSHG